MTELHNKQCIPCSGTVAPLNRNEKERLKSLIHGSWYFSSQFTHLKREIETKDFNSSMEIAKAIALLAHEQWHHPVLTIGFGKLDVEIWTHKISDLVESDFVFASKVDKIVEGFNEL